MTHVFEQVAPLSTLYIPFDSFNSDGASVTLTGLAVADIKVYKNGSVTQRASTSGFTLLDTDGIDFDGLTGIHGVSIDLADNADAGFYVPEAWYWVIIDAVTIDGQTVRFVAAIFRISLQALASKALGYVVVGSGSSQTNIVLGTIYPAGLVNDQFNNRRLVFLDTTATANLRGQGCSINDFDQATPAFTVSQLTNAPASGDIAAIF